MNKKVDLAQWRHEGYAIYQGRGLSVWAVIKGERKEFASLDKAKAAIDYVVKKPAND